MSNALRTGTTVDTDPTLATRIRSVYCEQSSVCNDGAHREACCKTARVVDELGTWTRTSRSPHASTRACISTTRSMEPSVTAKRRRRTPCAPTQSSRPRHELRSSQTEVRATCVGCVGRTTLFVVGIAGPLEAVTKNGRHCQGLDHTAIRTHRHPNAGVSQPPPRPAQVVRERLWRTRSRRPTPSPCPHRSRR
jgi:hypothetical protein